jgi:hypothetical protein
VSGYAATARIRGATPRLVAAEHDPWADLTPAVEVADGAAELEAGSGDTLPTPPPTLAERWESARERWAQLTFYLLSPESWR